MKRAVFSAACLMLLASLAAVPQECKKTEYTADHQKYMATALEKFTACTLPLDNACRAQVAQALEQLYGVKDFGSEQKYMTPAEIGKKVTGDSNWEHVGSASDQNALKTAQSNANCGRAVVAVMTSETGGHVAIILPGTLAHSTAGSWTCRTRRASSPTIRKSHFPGNHFPIPSRKWMASSSTHARTSKSSAGFGPRGS